MSFGTQIYEVSSLVDLGNRMNLSLSTLRGDSASMKPRPDSAKFDGALGRRRVFFLQPVGMGPYLVRSLRSAEALATRKPKQNHITRTATPLSAAHLSTPHIKCHTCLLVHRISGSPFSHVGSSFNESSQLKFQGHN